MRAVLLVGLSLVTLTLIRASSKVNGGDQALAPLVEESGAAADEDKDLDDATKEAIAEGEVADKLRSDEGCQEGIHDIQGLVPTSVLLTPKQLLDNGDAVLKGERVTTRMNLDKDEGQDAGEEEANVDDNGLKNPSLLDSWLIPTNRFLDKRKEVTNEDEDEEGPEPEPTPEADANPWGLNDDETPEEGAADEVPPVNPCNGTASAMSPSYAVVRGVIESAPVLGMPLVEGRGAAGEGDKGKNEEDSLDPYALFDQMPGTAVTPHTSSGSIASQLNLDPTIPSANANGATPSRWTPSLSVDDQFDAQTTHKAETGAKPKADDTVEAPKILKGKVTPPTPRVENTVDDPTTPVPDSQSDQLSEPPAAEAPAPEPPADAPSLEQQPARVRRTQSSLFEDLQDETPSKEKPSNKHPVTHTHHKHEHQGHHSHKHHSHNRHGHRV